MTPPLQPEPGLPSSALPTLRQLRDKLLAHYHWHEWAPPPVADAHAPDASAQERDDDNARPLSLPPLNLFASLRVRQDEENGNVAARPSLPQQRQVTKHITSWALPNRCSAVRLLIACVMCTCFISLDRPIGDHDGGEI